MDYRGLFVAIVAVSASCSAQAQEGFFGKAPVTSEVTTRIESGSAKVLTEALSVRLSPEQIDLQVRQFIEGRLKTQSEANALNIKAKAHGEETAPRKIGNKWFGNYLLTIDGIPVSDATQVSSVVLEDGSSAIIRERNTPKSVNFDSSRLGTAAARVSQERATQAARREVARLADTQKAAVNAQSLETRDSRLEVWVDPDSHVGKLAWLIKLVSPAATRTVPIAINAWVDALATGDNPEVYEVKQLVAQEHAGKVTGQIWDPTPVHPTQVRALSAVQVIRAGSVPAATEDVAVTDADGKFRFPVGDGAKSFSVRLANKYFVVHNDQGELVTIKSNGNSTQAIELAYTGTLEPEVAQPSAFYWANRAREFLAEVLNDRALLNIQLWVNATDECNSYWDPVNNSITLSRASLPNSDRTCINRAYVDTIFHEFGHAVDFSLGGMTNGPDAKSYAEGFADSIAILFKAQSCYGADSNGPGQCLRDAANPPFLYPSKGADVHDRGRIYSGFTWELIQQLSKSFGAQQAIAMAKELTLQSAAQNPSTIEKAVENVFLADDDDLDLSNGTPHAKQIVAAAKSRNIPLPAGLPH
jgi:hypothetical protein